MSGCVRSIMKNLRLFRITGESSYHCFGCGVGGNVITFVMEYENYTFLEAVKYLADKAGMQLPETSYSEEERKTGT